MNEDYLISIVLPIYNVEDYLDRCMESVVNQTYRNLEIIMVDDGATDSCPGKCDEWARRDNRIKVIHKQNAGLGMARNTGLDHASGEYVLFVDSDDYIDLDLCEKALSKISETKADICFFGSKRDVNGLISGSNISIMKDCYSGNELIDDFLINTIAQAETESGAPRIEMAAWGILYSAELIRKANLRFYSERDYLNEDLFFRINLVRQISKAVVLHEDLYYYCFNGKSLTMRYRQDRFEASKRMYHKIVEETGFCQTDEMKKRCCRAFMNNLLVCIRQEVKYKKEIGIRANERLKEYCYDPLVEQILSYYPIERLPFQPRLLYTAVKKRWIQLLKILVILKGIK